VPPSSGKLVLEMKLGGAVCHRTFSLQ